MTPTPTALVITAIAVCVFGVAPAVRWVYRLPRPRRTALRGMIRAAFHKTAGLIPRGLFFGFVSLLGFLLLCLLAYAAVAGAAGRR